MLLLPLPLALLPSKPFGHDSVKFFLRECLGRFGCLFDRRCFISSRRSRYALLWHGFRRWHFCYDFFFHLRLQRVPGLPNPCG